MILLTVSYVVVMLVWWILLLSTERLLLKRGRLLRIDEWQKSAYADEISHELLQRASKHFLALQEEIISSVQESTGGAL